MLTTQGVFIKHGFGIKPWTQDNLMIFSIKSLLLNKWTIAFTIHVRLLPYHGEASYCLGRTAPLLQPSVVTEEATAYFLMADSIALFLLIVFVFSAITAASCSLLPSCWEGYYVSVSGVASTAIFWLGIGILREDEGITMGVIRGSRRTRWKSIGPVFVLR